MQIPTNIPTVPQVPLADEEQYLSCDSLADLVLDIWRLRQRAEREGVTERVMTAIERTEDRLQRLGFQTDTMQQHPYSENLRVKVIEHIDAEGPRSITECLTPAVYFGSKLIRMAEVITRGRD